MAPSYASPRGSNKNLRNVTALGTVAEESQSNASSLEESAAAKMQALALAQTFPKGQDSTSRISAWDRRKRRLQKKKVDASEDENPNGGSKPDTGTRRGRSKSSSTTTPDESVDPYESDPGESYREHCLKFNGISTKTCLGIPKFMLKQQHTRGISGSTVLTAPPSPLASDMGDLFGAIPASLPAKMTRVRYSLRSSITDGSEKQPSGPSVMDRRDLRPNHVHLNVSHWSDEGGRPYMEDRYVLVQFGLL
jgi:hypothetical protein